MYKGREQFWMDVLGSYLTGLEDRPESVALDSVEADMVEVAMLEINHPTAWPDKAMSKETLRWMYDNCPCEIWIPLP